MVHALVRHWPGFQIGYGSVNHRRVALARAARDAVSGRARARFHLARPVRLLLLLLASLTRVTRLLLVRVPPSPAARRASSAPNLFCCKTVSFSRRFSSGRLKRELPEILQKDYFNFRPPGAGPETLILKLSDEESMREFKANGGPLGGGRSGRNDLRRSGSRSEREHP